MNSSVPAAMFFPACMHLDEHRIVTELEPMHLARLTGIDSDPLLAVYEHDCIVDVMVSSRAVSREVARGRTGYLQVGLAMGRVVDEPCGVAGLGAVHRHLAVQPERVAPLDVVRQLAAERDPRSDSGNAGW